MLVYGKYDATRQPTLYGTMANIPAANDEEIKYVDDKGNEVTFDPTWLTEGKLVDAGYGRFNILGDDIHKNIAMVVVTPGTDANEDGDYDDEGDTAPEQTVVTPLEVTEDEATEEAGAGEDEDTGDGNDLE